MGGILANINRGGGGFCQIADEMPMKSRRRAQKFAFRTCHLSLYFQANSGQLFYRQPYSQGVKQIGSRLPASPRRMASVCGGACGVKSLLDAIKTH
jgi:hypothetical protein